MSDIYEQPEYQLLLKRYTALRKEYAQLSDDYDTLLYCSSRTKSRGLESGPTMATYPEISTRSMPLTPNITPDTRIASKHMRFQPTNLSTPNTAGRDASSLALHPNTSSYMPMMPPEQTASLISRYTNQANASSSDESEGEGLLHATSHDRHAGSPNVSQSPGSGEFKCPHCAACLSTAYVLRRHIRAKHTEGSTRLHCEECSASFSYASDLKRHVLSKHEGQKYVCPHCGKEYARDSSLREHVRKMH